MEVPVTLFTLPLELRLLIWDLCPPPSDEPEVLIIRKEHADDEGTLLPLRSLMVDTAFPVLIHVCHESRVFSLRHSTMRFRFCPEAGCKVPCRPFRFDLDTLYCGEGLKGLAFDHGWVAEVRYLAIPALGTSRIAGGPTADFLLRKCRELRSLSVVFCGTLDGGVLEPEFREPTRRCKLRRIQPDSARVMMQVADQVRQGNVEDFMTAFREALLKQGEYFRYLYGNYTGWSRNSMRVSLIDLAYDSSFAQMLMEWRNGEWAEACVEERLLEGGKTPLSMCQATL
ncbi:hypothetical protein N0V88_001702 [Collariella sp. IMI 366227]|nr:hypothetical protein N0V88_001702 [Collariella sp. IMI 366227]